MAVLIATVYVGHHNQRPLEQVINVTIMEIEADCIISSERFDKYGLDERRRTSKERVQDFLDRGLMSKGEVQSKVSSEPVLIQSSRHLSEVHRGVI